ncbi:hypothetical protein D3C80_970030 [compost metagenome]
MPVGTLGLDALAQLRELFRPAHRGVGRQVLVHRVTGQRRAPVPDLTQQVHVCHQLRSTRLQPLSQLARRSQGHDRTIHCHATVGLDVFAQPFQRPGFARQQFHQFDAAALQLLLCLLPVAAVDPQPGKAGGDHQRTNRAMEPRKPLAPLPVTGQVFGKVGVGRGDQQGIDAPCRHGLAHVHQSLRHALLKGGLDVHALSCGFITVDPIGR